MQGSNSGRVIIFIFKKLSNPKVPTLSKFDMYIKKTASYVIIEKKLQKWGRGKFCLYL